MEISESMVITVTGIGIAGMLGVMYYFRSIILTSRCVEWSCCCCHIRNDPVEDERLGSIIDHEAHNQYNMRANDRV